MEIGKTSTALVHAMLGGKRPTCTFSFINTTAHPPHAVLVCHFLPPAFQRQARC
jgi:hypothetical protein